MTPQFTFAKVSMPTSLPILSGAVNYLGTKGHLFRKQQQHIIKNEQTQSDLLLGEYTLETLNETVT